MNVNGRTYLPVRDTANALGYVVASVSSSKIELKSGATKTSSNNTSDKTGSTNNTSKPSDSKGEVYVKNLRETYSIDGKLDATRIREALNNGSLDVNAQDEGTGNTLLHYVILENNFNAYTAIKRNALNVNIQNKEGQTPLHISVTEKNIFFFSELKELKANANIKDNSGSLPIDYAQKNSVIELGLEAYMM